MSRGQGAEMGEKLAEEIRAYVRRWGGWTAIGKYGRGLVAAAFIPED